LRCATNLAVLLLEQAHGGSYLLSDGSCHCLAINHPFLHERLLLLCHLIWEQQLEANEAGLVRLCRLMVDHNR
jgi:hypothetical protein